MKSAAFALVWLAWPVACVVAQTRTNVPLQLFLQQRCCDCHAAEFHEANIRLDHVSELPSAAKVDLLNRIEEQVYLRKMPPSGDELTEREREQFLSSISASFKELDTNSIFREKLKSPGHGNYVDHASLFQVDLESRAYTPARLWRTSPHVFDSVKSELNRDVRKLRQPFVVDDRQGIQEYAALLFADSAVVDVLLTNAATVADNLIEGQDVFRGIAASETRPTDAALLGAIQPIFSKVVYRSPSAQELNGYVTLFRKAVETADNFEALRVVLMAILLHHESVYRVEIGLGATSDDGRRMLAPAELAFAIAYTLTDERPDQRLMDAAQSGHLLNKEDVRREVLRILEDETIEKPRILRFFQQFFGYVHAHKVFKDAKRSGGFAYYGENYPEMYERDADFFVMNILEEDEDVFRKLLTSKRYYILNRQTFRNTIYDFYQENKERIDKGELSEALNRELLDRLDLRDWSQLNKKYHLHKFNRGFNGTAKAIKQIVKEVRQWKNTTEEFKLLHGMQPLYKKYPMVYDLEDEEQDFLLPQPYARPNRAGMLTHPAWLIAHSLNDTTDPIRRGKWILERLLAGTVPDLPITVDATVPEDPHKTLRERLAVTEKEECWRCHEKMNPLGYPFEIYDDFGRFRTAESLDKLPKVEGKHPQKAVNATSLISQSPADELNGEVRDALELIDKLANSDRVRQSIIRHAFRYFLGRNEMLSDGSTLIAADAAYLKSGGSFNALIVSLMTSDSFLYRK